MLRDDLLAHLKTFRTAPFLFVGSGMSRRYLGLEDWEGLLKKYAEPTGQSFVRFKSDADDLPGAASAIARKFNPIWWEDNAYADSRAAFESDITRFDSPMKVEICRHMDAALDALDMAGQYEEELRLFGEVQVDGIITTNYDGLLERLFPGFKAFVGQDDVLFSETQSVGEIYKIHGSTTKPNSLVLTGEDYENFNGRNAYLAAKLLTIFVDHPVVFLGYSIQDPNILSILDSIAVGLTSDHLQKLQDRLIFIEWDRDAKDPELKSGTFAFRQGSVIPVRHAIVSDYSPIYSALASVERQFPARVLRQLKHRVYELVQTTDPVGALRVIKIDADDPEAKNLDVVFGVGVIDRIGYLGLNRENLIEDVLHDTGGFDAERLLQTAMPQLLRETKLTPIYKYLRAGGMLTDEGNLPEDLVIAPEITARIEGHDKLIEPSPTFYRTKGDEIVATGIDFAGLVEAEEPWKVLMYVTRLPDERQDVDALYAFLLEHRADLHDNSTNTTHKTHWIKAVCLYDRLRFGAAAA